MSLWHRLKRLEQVRRDTSAIGLLCVGKQGIVLDDGSAETHPPVFPSKPVSRGKPRR
jgi:hypothetical protein